jgi:hypothetical protein
MASLDKANVSTQHAAAAAAALSYGILLRMLTGQNMADSMELNISLRNMGKFRLLCTIR